METPLFAVMLKINLLPLKTHIIDDEEQQIEMQNYLQILCEPFMSFLKNKNVNVRYYTSGLHTNGKKKLPHIHAHYLCQMETDASGVPCKMLVNTLANYKYFYAKSWGTTVKNEHFKKFTHSVRISELQHRDDDIDNVLAYPYKEVIDERQMWKLGKNQILPENRTQQNLVTRGAGIYVQSIRNNLKIVDKEKTKLEKWGEFCLYMDELRKTPTKHQMETLRGVCIVALEYHRQRSERTSVNAVITMCKDYAFKRNIWTNNEILDKYNII